MDFKKLEFGKADAFEEGSEFPNLLINGYLDTNGVVELVLERSAFLFLGYKGSGKSALGEHLRLKNDYNIFVTSVLLKDFPYKSFSKIISGNENESKLPATWGWLLLTYAIDSLSKDNGATTEVPNELSDTLVNLRKIGVLPVLNIHDFVTKSSKNSFKISIASTFEFGTESGPEIKESDLKFMHVVNVFKKIISNFRSSSKHIIVIDGLDEILTSREVQYQAIAALIDEAKSLNNFFRTNNVPIKIIVLCRVDIFERLPHPNKNKIRQDSAFVFDWYSESTTASQSNLVELVNLRGKLSYPEINDVFKEFFPASFDGKSIYSDLLSFTRHTPRDFLQLMKYIQSSTKGDKVTHEAISTGVKAYSINYFFPEIKDELVGYLDYNLLDDFIRLISTLRKREFALRDVQTVADTKPSYKSLNLEYIFNALFECSAIGHVNHTGQQSFFTFKYRNRNVSFNPTERIVLHKGIWKSLNLVD